MMSQEGGGLVSGKGTVDGAVASSPVWRHSEKTATCDLGSGLSPDTEPAGPGPRRSSFRNCEKQTSVVHPRPAAPQRVARRDQDTRHAATSPTRRKRPDKRLHGPLMGDGRVQGPVARFQQLCARRPLKRTRHRCPQPPGVLVPLVSRRPSSRDAARAGSCRGSAACDPERPASCVSAGRGRGQSRVGAAGPSTQPAGRPV